MKIVNTGFEYRIYSDDLHTYDSLPAKTYSLEFSKMSGFFLVERENICVTEKIYGCHQSKVDKIMKSFKLFTRNLGVILSGDKGIGKSICAKMLAEKCISEGYPVILVNQYVCGIADYLASIKQEVLILFDEFDKTFKDNSGDDKNGFSSQSELLTLFDGVHSGKKLFVVTCNNIRCLNEFLVNRPGRFHYHLRFEYPSPAEIREYLEDKLDKSLYREIDKVVSFSGRVDVNYDCLRSIAFELSCGESFESAIKDLNIVNLGENIEYSAYAIFEDGTRASRNRVYLDFFGSSENSDEVVRFEYTDGLQLYLTLDLASAKYDPNNCVTIIPPDGIRKEEWCDRDGDDVVFDESAGKPAISRVVFKRKVEKGIHYNF